jgi:hypothetical protein
VFEFENLKHRTPSINFPKIVTLLRSHPHQLLRIQEGRLLQRRQGEEDFLEKMSNNPIIQNNEITPLPDVHTLRSSTTYIHNDNLVPQTNSLKTALYKAFQYFKSGSPIPTSLMAKLDSFTVDSDARYFAAGTGTRWWVGIEVFKDPDGTNRWWAGHASQRIVNGQFHNVADISPESMSIIQTNNVDLNIPAPLMFRIQVSTLIHPCASPANYPATLDINLENIRQLIVSLL